jgi:hypothetical protein
MKFTDDPSIRSQFFEEVKASLDVVAAFTGVGADEHLLAFFYFATCL